jgi:hypothetical protein
VVMLELSVPEDRPIAEAPCVARQVSRMSSMSACD